MTAPTTTMNRVIHAAVRRDLDRLATALDTFRDGDRDRAQGLERAYTNLRVQLTHHHEGEDTHIWPMMQRGGTDSALLRAMESEHHTMSEALAETAGAMRTFAAGASAADASGACHSVVRTRDVVERHLRHEEDELEPELTKYLDTPEWHAVEKKLSRQPPGVAGRFFAWLTDGMSPGDRAFLKQTVPTPVVTVLSKVFGRSYHREVAPVWRETACR